MTPGDAHIKNFFSLSVDMHKITIAFFLKSSSFSAKGDLISSKAFATRVSTFVSASLRAAEVSALPELRNALERKKASILKEGTGGYLERGLRVAESSLDTEISTVKTTRKSKAKTRAEGHAEDSSACFVAVKKATQLKGVQIIKIKNAAIEETEELASCALTCAVPKDLAEILGEIDLNAYRFEARWKQVARKLLDYGIHSNHIIAMLKKCRKLFCSVIWVDSTLKHFAQLGMSHLEMGKVIVRLPTILNVTDSMFRRKIEFFESIGIDRHYLGKRTELTAVVMMTNLSTLRKNTAFWTEHMKDVRVNAICGMMLSNPQILGYKSYQQKVAWLESKEFDKKWFLTGSPVLSLTLPGLISKAEMLEHLGISSARKRGWVLIVLARTSIPNMQQRFDNLLAAGFSIHQAHGIVHRAPSVLSMTVQNVNAKIHYVLNVMNASLDTLALSAKVWSHKLETRVKDRHEVIKRLQSLGALQQDISLDTMIRMKAVDFNRRFVEKLHDIEIKADRLRA